MEPQPLEPAPTHPLMTANADELACALELAKETEDTAKIARIKAENDLIEVIGVELEGSTTTTTDHYKITITGKINRTIHQLDMTDILQNSTIPSEIKDKVVRSAYQLNTSFYKSLKDSDPEAYGVIAGAITTKPAKTAVTIKRLED